MCTFSSFHLVSWCPSRVKSSVPSLPGPRIWPYPVCLRSWCTIYSFHFLSSISLYWYFPPTNKIPRFSSGYVLFLSFSTLHLQSSARCSGRGRQSLNISKLNQWMDVLNEIQNTSGLKKINKDATIFKLIEYLCFYMKNWHKAVQLFYLFLVYVLPEQALFYCSKGSTRFALLQFLLLSVLKGEQLQDRQSALQLGCKEDLFWLYELKSVTQLFYF